MAEIVDLGNGFAMLKGYNSIYANLHFRLTPGKIRQLYRNGYLNRDEYYFWLGYLGYRPTDVEIYWKLDNLRSIFSIKKGEKCQPPDVMG